MELAPSASCLRCGLADSGKGLVEDDTERTIGTDAGLVGIAG